MLLVNDQWYPVVRSIKIPMASRQGSGYNIGKAHRGCNRHGGSALSDPAVQGNTLPLIARVEQIITLDGRRQEDRLRK